MNTKIIAEIGWNHMGDESLAESMIESASKSGATVAKFQYWDPKYLKSGEWDTDGRREIYNKAALTEQKINKAIEKGIIEGFDTLNEIDANIISYINKDEKINLMFFKKIIIFVIISMGNKD